MFNTLRIALIIGGVIVCMSHVNFAQELRSDQPALEVYGNLPAVRSVALSDTGNKVAVLRADQEGDYVLVQDLVSRERTGFRIEGFKPISVDFFGDRYVVLRASSTETLFNVSGKFEYGFSFIFDTQNETVEQLLEGERGLVPGTDASRIVGVLAETGELLLPAWTYSARSAGTNSVGIGISGIGSTVYRVKPETGRIRVFEGDRQSSRLGSGSKAKYPFAINWVDPDRICTVGASYGGYAALAGAMTAPDLFACVAAIAPVTDLPEFMTFVVQNQGPRSYAYEYWSTSIGRAWEDAPILRTYSPSRHADEFTTPVLLVHGTDDTVVPLNQSRKMHTALSRSGKSVRMVELSGADHWLTTSETRLATLESVAEFIERHIGAADF